MILIRKFRELRGLSQKELADRSGITPSQISRFEHRKQNPSSLNLIKLAHALDISLDHLIGRVIADVGRLTPIIKKMPSEDLDMVCDFADLLVELRKRSLKVENISITKCDKIPYDNTLPLPLVYRKGDSDAYSPKE